MDALLPQEGARRKGACSTGAWPPTSLTMWRTSWMVVLLLVALPLGACAVPLESYQVARSRAPSDLQCEQVTQGTTRNSGSFVHAFEGCGRYVIYECMSGSQGAACQAAAIGEGRAWDNRQY